MMSIFFPSIIGAIIFIFGFWGLVDPKILNSLFSFLLDKNNRLLAGSFWLLAGVGLFLSASESIMSIFAYIFAILMFMDSLILLLSSKKFLSTILFFITNSKFSFRFYFTFLIFCGLILLTDFFVLLFSYLML